MQFNYDLSWNYLEIIFSENLPIEDAWKRFVFFHENLVPKQYWTSLKQIDIISEKIELTDLLHHVINASPIPDNIISFWIGIIRLEHNEKEIPAIYIIGSDSYNPDNIDWVSVPLYLPENRYFILDGLIEIDNEIKNDEIHYGFLDWILPLAYCTFLLDDIFKNNIDLKLLPKKKIHITTGHDSGDYMHLTSIDNKKGDS